MAKVLIEIDVLNSAEILKERKGKFVNWAASILYNEEDIKKKIEKKICQKIVQELRMNLDQGFLKEGVSAKVKISAKI